jgi:dihydrofolate reductase
LESGIARHEGRVDWLATSDEFAGGDALEPEHIEAVLGSIGCYRMGSQTYETARRFEAQGPGWSYGDEPIVVLTSRELRKVRDTVVFYSGDLAQLVNVRLRIKYQSLWFVCGGAVSAECLRLELVDEVRDGVLPILVGDGVPAFDGREDDVALHLTEVKAFDAGMVELCYEVRERGE